MGKHCFFAQLALLTNDDSVWVDWLHPMAEDYWAAEMKHFHDRVHFDAVWVDLNEISSACSYSCGNDVLNDSQLVTPPQLSNLLPQDPRKLNDPPYKINKYV